MDPHDPRAAMLAADEAIKQANPAPAEMVPPGGTINVNVRMGDGAELVGAFTFRLPLSVNDQTRIGNVSGRMRGGLPVEAFTADKAGIIEMVAFLQVALTDVPAWARDDDGAMNLGELPAFLVEHLYGEVAQHAQRFRDACELRGPDQG